MISDDELLGLDEFALLPENAEQIGATGHCRRSPASTSGPISALKWGDAAPQVVFLHGGGQNAHTWDTVILGLGVPALAVDLPGHGRSAWREDGDYGPKLNAETLRPVLREWAPDAAPGRRHVARRADRAAHRRHRARPGARAGARRRHTVGARAARADDQGADGHRRAGAGRPHLPQLRRHARRDRRRGPAPRPEIVAARRLPQLQAARRRHLDVALRLVPQGRGLRGPVGRRPRHHHADHAGARRQLVLRQRRGRRGVRRGRARLPAHPRRRRLRALGAGRPARARSSRSCAECSNRPNRGEP